jgi:isopenicillin-N epimerase
MITEALRSQFLLRKDITFLNFGSFGACPKPIFDRYQQYQLELEQEPVEFIVKTGMQYLKDSRIALGKYLHCHEDDLVFMVNPSHAVNLIAKSFALAPGDEILTTDLEYGACDRTIQYYCDKAGAKYIRQKISLPIVSKQAFIEEFFKGVTEKTKMIFISHITSSTGLRFPVEEICAKAKQMGIISFVDGAHAPGQVPLNLSTLDADIYTGACHKWMMAPKGCTFLYVRKALQDQFDPLVISWGYNSTTPSHSRFLDYHQTQGTRDFSAFCTVPTVIDFMEKNQWPEVAKECRKIVHENAMPFCSLLQTSPLAPIHEDFIVQLFSIPIKTATPVLLKDCLFEKYKIEIPVMQHADKVYLRYSIQVFNTQADLDKLTDAIKDIIKTTNLIEL